MNGKEEDKYAEENHKIRVWTARYSNFRVLLLTLLPFILSSDHPYLFLNQDCGSLTFLGLWVDKNGSLINIKNGNVVKKNFIPTALREILRNNTVNFEEDYDSWDM